MGSTFIILEQVVQIWHGLYNNPLDFLNQYMLFSTFFIETYPLVKLVSLSDAM